MKDRQAQAFFFFSSSIANSVKPQMRAPQQGSVLNMLAGRKKSGIFKSFVSEPASCHDN